MPNAFRHGDHICSICDNEAEQLATAAAYLADGIVRGERCAYIGANRGALLRFDAALGKAGLDAVALLDRGALIELTHEEAYLAGGRFVFARMLENLNSMHEQALHDGFLGLRGCGDMSWLLAGAPGSEQVLEYEALLNQFFSDTGACAMCQYNRQLLPARTIDMALSTHSTAVIAGEHKFNPFFQSVMPGGDGPPRMDES